MLREYRLKKHDFLRTKGLFKNLVNLNTEEYRLAIFNIEGEQFTQTRLSTGTLAHALMVNKLLAACVLNNRK